MSEVAEVLEIARQLAAMPAGNMTSKDPERYAAKRDLHRLLREALKQMNEQTVEAPAAPAPKEENTKMNSVQKNSMDTSIEVYRKLTQVYGVGKRHQTSTSEAVEKTGFTEGQVAGRSRLYQTLGLLKMEIEFEWQKQKVFWTLMKPAYEGEQLIREWFESGKTLADVPTAGRKRRSDAKTPEPVERVAVPTPEKPENNVGVTPNPEPGPLAEKVAVRMNGETPVEAIAGPDAPSPFESLRAVRKNEAEALIEAAKQYADRKDAVERSFQNLEAMGMKIDRQAAMQAISYEQDPVLDAVTALLPYISTLEAQVSQVTTWKQEVTSLRREKGVLQDMYNRERDANKRLAERMAARTANS